MIVLLSHLVVLLFFLTFDGSIVTLGSTNITSDCTFATFGNTLFFLLGILYKVIIEEQG